MLISFCVQGGGGGNNFKNYSLLGLKPVLVPRKFLGRFTPLTSHRCSETSTLHWLRSMERIDFKLAVLVYRCLHGLAPRYLSDHIQRVADCNRRSALVVVTANDTAYTAHNCTVGDRAFPVSRLGKSLPHDVISSLITDSCRVSQSSKNLLPYEIISLVTVSTNTVQSFSSSHFSPL